MELGKVDLSLQEMEGRKELNNYINNRLADVRFYLRGINYNKLNSIRAVEGLSDNIDLLFNEKVLEGNKENMYRLLLDRFVIDIKNAYDSLTADDLEFAVNEKEVEESISKFELKIKELIKKFRDNVLSYFNKETGCPTSIIDTNIDEINVKIRNRKEKITQAESHEKNELYGLREIIIIVYVLMDFLKDKSNKLDNFKCAMEEQYEAGSLEYRRFLGYWIELKNIRNHSEFVEAYEYMLDKSGLDVRKSKKK